MDSNTYDKPFKTYEELIAIMEARHIEITDKEFAIQALQKDGRACSGTSH